MYASVGRRWIVYEYFGILSEKRYGLTPNEMELHTLFY